MGLPDCQFVNNVASGYNPVVHGLGRWILNTTPWLLTLGLVLRTWEDGHTWITAVVAGGLLAMAAADFAGTVWATPRSHFSVPALGAALLGAAAFFLAWLDRASPSYSHPRSHSAFLAVVAVVSLSGAVVTQRRHGRWLYKYRRWERAAKGACFTCGYDLRGNCSGVCPECGAPIGTA
jgi:hypothetical protein